MDKQSEQKLVEKLKANSYSSFTILYNHYAPRLYAFVNDYVCSRDLAKDIVQETFLNIWENRLTINPNLSFKSYLFTIAKNKFVNEFRRQVNHPLLPSYFEYCSNQELTTEVQLNLDFPYFQQQLEKAKQKLSERQCEIFVLNKEEGFSISAIAIKTNLTEQSVRNQLYLALKILRKELKGYYKLLFLLFFVG